MTKKKRRPMTARQIALGPQFDGEIERWGLWFLKREFWRIASMYSREELNQEAFFVFWQVRCRHPNVHSRRTFLKIYKTSLRWHVTTMARQCFPNPYNAGSENRCISLTGPDGRDRSAGVLSAAYGYASNEAEACLDLMQRVPPELRESFAILLREIMGWGSIVVSSERLVGRRSGLLPFERALMRKVGLGKMTAVLHPNGPIVKSLKTTLVP